MRRFAPWIVLLAATGCSGAAPRPAQTSKPRCPTAAELWPVLEWSGAVMDEAVPLLARTILEGDWLRDRKAGGGKPRLEIARFRNRTSFHMALQALSAQVATRLHESGAVTVVDTAPQTRPDGIVHVVIHDLLEASPGQRTAGFRFELAIADAGVEPALPGTKAWRRTVQISRRLTPARRPARCPEPTWFCTGIEGRALKTGCGVTWTCRNGRFSISCEPPVSGKASCRCEGGDSPPRPLVLPDPCVATDVEGALQQAANRACGWRLPGGR